MAQQTKYLSHRDYANYRNKQDSQLNAELGLIRTSVDDGKLSIDDIKARLLKMDFCFGAALSLSAFSVREKSIVQ
jgi:hypothetical protein